MDKAIKLDYKKTVKVGLAFLSISLFWQFYYAFMPLTLTQVFGLSDVGRGVVMSIDNVVALIMLPLFGYISDKRQDKVYGRRTPFILIGTLLSVVLFLGMAVLENMQLQELIAGGNIITPGNTAEEIAAAAVKNQQTALALTRENPMVFVGFITLLVLVLFAMGTYRTPAVALMPDVTPKPLRSQANAVINIMGGLGGLLATVIFTLVIKDYKSRIAAYCAIAILMAVSIALFYALVREPKLVQERERAEEDFELSGETAVPGVKTNKAARKSLIFLLASIAFWFLGYYSIYSSFTIYANQELGIKDGASGIFFIVAMLVSAVAFIPIAYFSNRVGRKKTIMGGIVILAAAMGLGGAVGPGNIWLMYILFPIVGASWAAINVNSLPMVVEMAKAKDVGKFTGAYYAASMAAQGIAPIVSGFFMTAIDRKILFPISAVFTALSFITMFFVKHGDVINGNNTAL